MISLVCVFNDRRMLETRLVASVQRQTTPPELVTVDNESGRFASAAHALDFGAAQAKGEWLVFLHQDVVLLSPDWTGRVQRRLDQLRPGGWVGVAGSTRAGRFRGFLRDRALLMGHPFPGLEPVQTLDECVLIHARNGGGRPYFDASVPGWHTYGVEACCRALRQGQLNYVLPVPVWHDSRSINLQGLDTAHRYVWDKHGAALGRISTSCGVLPDLYGWAGSARWKRLKRVRRRLRAEALRLRGYRGNYRVWFNDVLESLTQAETAVDCLHAPSDEDPIEAAAFVPHPGRTRRVTHSFRGLDPSVLASPSVVLAADLTAALPDEPGALDSLPSGRRLIACIRMDDARHKPKLWRALRKRGRTWLTLEWDDTATAVCELAP